MTARRKLSLLQKFGLISLVAIALIGLGLGRLLRSSVERQVLSGAIAQAEVVSRLGLQNAIGPHEVKNGMNEERIRALQISLRSDFARIDVVDVVLWNPDGTVVFATNTDLIGTQATIASPGLLQARSGEPRAVITDLSQVPDADPILRRHGTLVDVYQPVRFGSFDTGDTAGVLRTSVPYAPVAETITQETRRLYLALVAALVVLYMLLFRLMANASSELRRQADENEQLARHDALTGLPNRTLFTEELNAKLERNRLEPLTVALLDLDRFKEINDTLGHHRGDLLLVEIGRRLRTTLRTGDSVARLGGDEFALVLTGIGDDEAALRAADRIVQAIEEPFEIEDLRLDVGASVGLAIAPRHGDDLATLLQRADIAMYQAKRAGLGCAMYDADHDHHSRQQLTMAGELRRSMADQLVVHYQPKIDLELGAACGVEALVRWDHSEHGLLAPADFVPLAERNGMMHDLTVIVLDQSLAQLRTWLDEDRDLHLAVNVSASGLHDPAFADAIGGLLDRHRIAGDRLVLEVTETTIAADPDRARAVLGQLGRRGVRFSIDDFGTGYSSLAVLRSLPVHELKIDRRFVGDLGHPDGSAIVEYSVQLGHMLGLSVVAEGVEEPGDATRLRDLGCDVAQGFWYSRPVPGNELTAWLDRRDEPAAGRSPTAPTPR